MPGEICTMPECYNEVEYVQLQTCKPCYNRIRHAALTYGKTNEEAKAALSEIDETAIKHGMVNQDGRYARRRVITS